VLAYLPRDFGLHLIFLLRLADVASVDLEQAVKDKLKINEGRYPVDLARDNAIKYDRRSP
jgi:hypothetical protein